MKKKIVLILLGIYILFTFRISIEQNGDVFLRIIPVENIEYLFVPWKLKKMYRTIEKENFHCKRLIFSKNRILYLKDSVIRELILENDKVIDKFYIPEYTYAISDNFELKLPVDCYLLSNIINFTIVNDNQELYSHYFKIYDKKEISFPNSSDEKIITLLTQNPDAKFLITECRKY